MIFPEVEILRILLKRQLTRLLSSWSISLAVWKRLQPKAMIYPLPDILTPDNFILIEKLPDECIAWIMVVNSLRRCWLLLLTVMVCGAYLCEWGRHRSEEHTSELQS